MHRLDSNSVYVKKLSASLGTKLDASLKPIGLRISGQGGSIAIPRDHDKLHHLDYLESGHTGFAGIEFGTTAEWNADPQYRPVKGMIVVYTDYQQKIDESTGEIIYIPGFKIGDGNAYLIDKPFIGDDIRDLLMEHIEDTGIHIQPGEREFWNNKLNYEEPESDLLEFTRN